MKEKTVRLFIKTHCPWCHSAREWLDRHGVDYEELDVTKEPAFYDEMVRLSGQTSAPVIDVGGRILADFDTGELEEFWKSLGD
ncbi:MAG: glutaredoxin family protein [Verrucomicrobia bacterium]|nr:glutaredoxin family protein [Verrucomicrobiota bacterium]MCF7708024.1 glutaredoxin family protein [Verrucomicrobiota bacterium]